MSVIIAHDKDGDEFIVPSDKAVLKQTSSTETIQNTEDGPGIPVKMKKYWVQVVGQRTLNELWEVTKEVYDDLKEKILNTPEGNDIICEVENKKGDEK